MQIKTFMLPVASAEHTEEELNRFLRGHRVLQVERHFCPDSGGYWAVLAEYVDGDWSEEVYTTRKRNVPTRALTA